jgi:tRNA A-37 threonylcarbamoyl transferase component Bud32
MTKVKIVINPKFAHLTAAIRSIAYDSVPTTAETIYNERNAVYKLTVGEEVLSIKSFRVPNAVNKIVYTNLRKSKARRSYEAALKLNELGINSPTPIAYIEEKQGIKLHRSYYICRHIEATNMRLVETDKDKEFILKSLAAEIVKIHRAGVCLLDFSPGNVLYTRRDDGTLSFSHIDINRIAFGVTSRKKLFTMFERMFTQDDTLRLLAGEYAHLTGMSADEAATMAIAAHNAFNRRIAHKNRLKKLFKKHR